MLTVASHLLIDRLWDGGEAWPTERSELTFTLGPEGLSIEIRAPFHGDPPPTAPPSRTEALWEYEVVELFLANATGHYLELEFGPHGHHLALLFSGIRQLSRHDIPVTFQARIDGDSWRGSAQVAASYLPEQIHRANAYAIHGQEDRRRFLAAAPVPGPRPDFHQPQLFPPLPTTPLSSPAIRP